MEGSVNNWLTLDITNFLLCPKTQIQEKTQPQNVHTSPIKDTVSLSYEVLKQKEFLRNLDKIKNFSDIKNKTKEIGRGTEASVYKFNDYDLCIKIPYATEDFGKWTTDVSDKQRINYIIAESENGAKITKFIKGISLKEKPDEIYNLPESSYKQLIKQVSDAAKLGLFCDASGENIIYDSKEKKLTFIDLIDPVEIHREDLEGNRIVFESVYRALKSSRSNPRYKEKNKILLGRLLTVLLNEIKSKKTPDFIINYDDINIMLLMYEEDKPKLPKNYIELTKKINEILEIYEQKSPDENNKKIMNEKIERAQNIIDKDILSK